MKEKIKMIGFGAQVMLKQYDRSGRENGAFKILCVPSNSITIYRVSQKFVPLISCTITFDQNFIFT